MVTGCTAGVGEQYAYNLAAKNMNLLLVSRSKSKLERVAAQIGKDTNILKLWEFEEQKPVMNYFRFGLSDSRSGIFGSGLFRGPRSVQSGKRIGGSA